MKLRGISLQPFTLPLRTPLVTSRDRYTVRSGVLVRVEIDDGVVGLGEAMPLEAFGTEGLETATQVLALLGTQVAGWELEASAQGVNEFVTGLPGLASTPAARHGLESALLDAVSQLHGRTLAQELHPFPAESVQVNALLMGATPELLEEEADEARRAGFWTFKLKVGGRPLSEDMERLAAVRRAVGSARIRIDPNGCWSVEDAILSLRELAFFELELCEQPVPAANLDGLRLVHEQSPIPIAADEALTQPGAMEELVEASSGPGVSALVLKPMTLGGPLAALELARRAERAGVKVYVTSSFDGPVARMTAVQLAAAMPASGMAHGLAVGRFFEGPEPAELTPKVGAIFVPQGRGLGIRWSPVA